MKNILKLMIPAIAVALCTIQSANAQVDGYRFGVGLGYSGAFCGPRNFDRSFFGLPIAPTPRIDQPPFFALYPPVYYSQDIVSRPYGVSPYAAPSGIVPVEMSGVYPLHQVNPYFVDPNIQPTPGAPVPEATPPSANPKTTWIRNPYFDPMAAPGDAFAAK